MQWVKEGRSLGVGPEHPWPATAVKHCAGFVCLYLCKGIRHF